MTADLREYFNYDPETGLITWAKKRAYKNPAGSRAGAIDRTTGYIRLGLAGRLYYAHRVAWYLAHGEWPPEQIDHINGVRTDNRLTNLRLATKGQNAINRGPTCRNSSGVPGVRWDRKYSRWYARICANGVNKHLGTFATFDEAVAARKRAEAIHHGEFAPARAAS
jgi:hypothetical protein